MKELKCECGNKEYFRTWTEFEYSDGSNTSNELIEVEYTECLDCGETL